MKNNTLYVALLLSTSTIWLIGCGPSSSTVDTPSDTADVTPKQDFLKLGLGYLARLEQFEPRKGMMQTAYYLNRWIEDAPDDENWRRSGMLSDLPRSLREIQPLMDLEKREFTIDDIQYLREASWSQSISRWVATQDIDVPIAEWLDELEEEKGEAHAYDVELAFRLFDWTVRNLQLVPLSDYPAAQAGPNSGGGGGAAIDPIRMAVGGPGYTCYPWQNLMFGYADAWQRGRVFVQLARQQQLDVLMLAIDDPRKTPRPTPWLTAVLIDGDLYLFDPQLGIPIPGPDRRGIATLAQVCSDTKLLKSLDVGDALPYEAARADLDKVFALIDAAPEALSYRMYLIEAQQQLTEPLALTVDTDDLASRVGKCEGVSQVELWNTPLETWVYRTALERRCAQDPNTAAQVFYHEGLFEGLSPMTQGRMDYFRGRFEETNDVVGAKGYYLKACIPNSVIDQIPTSEEVQMRMGIVRQRQNDDEWQGWLMMQEGRIRRMKANVIYWLGQTQFETGSYDTAIDWFLRRTLEAEEPSPWADGARYNLARTYEALGRLEDARKLLLLDESPQKHGNLLRARWLREQMQKEAADESAAPADDDAS